MGNIKLGLVVLFVLAGCSSSGGGSSPGLGGGAGTSAGGQGAGTGSGGSGNGGGGNNGGSGNAGAQGGSGNTGNSGGSGNAGGASCDGAFHIGQNAVTCSNCGLGQACDGNVPQNCADGTFLTFDNGQCYCAAMCSSFQGDPQPGDGCYAQGWHCENVQNSDASNHAKLCVKDEWNLCTMSSGSGGTGGGGQGGSPGGGGSGAGGSGGGNCGDFGAPCEFSDECCSGSCGIDNTCE